MDKNNAIKLILQCESELKNQFARLDDIALYNQKKVLDAYKNQAIQARHMFGTTGYGYDDIGRDTLCRLYADIFHAQSAIVSPNIVSGTHALTLMLFGVLRPGEKLLAISGMPYDTLTDVIMAKNKGSLRDFGVKFDKIDLNQSRFDSRVRQRSHQNRARIRGYKSGLSRKKPRLQPKTSNQRGKSGRNHIFCQKISPKTLVLVDNCYGEFVEKIEPTDVGADLIAGSLIKNIGGGIAPTGGYVAGRADLVELVSYRLTAPSLGMEEGSYAYGYLPYYQGLFLAPSAVKNALKGSLLFAKTYTKLGFETLPRDDMPPFDIVTSIKLGSADKLIDFCGAIQEISPIDSNVKPMPWDMPGYQDQVIMAAGAFVQGSSIELSADSPIKEPYIVYVQGGLTYEHAYLAVLHTLETLNFD